MIEIDVFEGNEKLYIISVKGIYNDIILYKLVFLFYCNFI